MTWPVPGATRRPLERPQVVLPGALFLFVTLSRALSSEIVLDGVTYASIARNLAEGIGSFWSTSYTEHFTPFRMHPPLAFWLESWLFRLFGDTPRIDLLFGVITGVLSLWLTAVLWRQARRGLTLEPDPAAAAQSWWPLLLLLLCPLFSWCLTNNMLEDVLLVFSLGAVALAGRALGASAWPRKLGLAAASGALVSLAVLTKGPPGLFALAVPLCAWLFLGRTGAAEAVALSAATCASALAGVGLMVALGGPEARAFVAEYFELQLRASSAGAREVASSRAFLALVLLRELAAPFVLAAVLGRAWRTREEESDSDRRIGFFFLAVALAASLPFLFFAKQQDWYAMPSLPFFALGVASVFRSGACRVERWLERSRRLRRVALLVASLLAAFGVACATAFPGALQVGFGPAIAGLARRAGLKPPDPERTSEYCWRNFERDILRGGARMPPRQQVSVCARNSLWRVTAYLQRHLRASAVQRPGLRYLLVERNTGERCPVPAGCRALQREPTERFALFECPD